MVSAAMIREVLSDPRFIDTVVERLGGQTETTVTVREWAKEWVIPEIAGKGQKQRDAVFTALNLHILPIIGDQTLTETRYADCLRVMAAMPDASSSLRTKVLIVMRSMFEVARRNHLIAENPCDGIKAGGKRSAEKVPLNDRQIQVLEEAVAGTSAETFVLLGLYTGLRREEILGLMWDSVDLESIPPILTVRQAVRWEHNRPIVSPVLKSKAAFRTIPIPGRLEAHLRQIKKETGFVVGNTALTETQFKNLWRIVKNRQIGEKTYRKSHLPPGQIEKRTIERTLGGKARNSNVRYTIDFQVSPHILRHTYITQLILSGANLKRVQYLAGHSDPKVTLKIYTHLVDTSPRILADDVNKAFS